MASTKPIATLIEKDVESRLRVVMQPLHSLLRMCEDPAVPLKNRSRLDWRAATLRDAMQALEQPKRERKLTRDQRDIAADVARSIAEETK